VEKQILEKSEKSASSWLKTHNWLSMHGQQNIKSVRVIWGYEAFTETNFTHVFLFVIYDVYVRTVSSLNI
jgi:hypothetical protein